MSTESDKPFICTFQGCPQRFANNDHLIVHQQKHEFSLKFGASRQGDGVLVDQTPTPTRFLRNCEESGLFQELEANPFDQDFKQATNGSSQDTPKPSGLTEGSKSGTDMSKASSLARLSLTTKMVIGSASIPVAPPSSIVNPEKPVPMAMAPPHVSTATALTKQKLLENIQLKEQQKILEQHQQQQLQQLVSSGQASPEILAQALKTVLPVVSMEDPQSPVTEVVLSTTPLSGSEQILEQGSSGKRRRGRRPDDEEPEVKRQRFLERNRAAASRCRAKKKVWVDCLEKKAKELEVMNQTLQQEVLMLRSEVQQLKSILIAHKDCPLIVHQTSKPASEDVPLVTSLPPHTIAGVTLLSQLANMPSMSPLITSPIPSVGSIVPNIGSAHSTPTIIITTNGIVTQPTPEVGKDVEIAAEAESQTSDQQ